MKIAFISEAPSLTTGFGTTCKYIAATLVSRGYHLVYYAIGAIGETFDRSLYPYKIWAVGPPLPEMLKEFLSYEQPDLVFIHADVGTITGIWKLLRGLNWKGPIITYFVVDGIPVRDEHLRFLTDVQGKITATHATANYVRQVGFEDIRVVPHGVDTRVFRPLPNRKELRVNANMDYAFVVGVFGRNAERKQQPRVMLALASLKRNMPEAHFLLYLHCQPVDSNYLGGWNLVAIAHHLGISEIIRFPGDNFNQLLGVPYTSKMEPTAFDSYSYVERMNCCDLIINPSFCGGFEKVIIEAQACGIPIAITNDKGNMKEVAGENALLLEPQDYGYWKSGSTQYFVSHETITETIVSIRENPKLKKSVIDSGLTNVSQYSWDNVGQCVSEVVQEILEKA